MSQLGANMKKIFTLLTGLVLMVAVGTATALEAKGWRLTITDSIANDTKVVVSEIEWLHNADYEIDAVTTGSGGSFAFKDEGVGNVTDQFPADATFTVSDSTGNDGTYTVDSSSFDNGTNVTTVVVDGTVSDSTVDGTITTISRVDGTRSDLGKTACGWTRNVSNLTGAKQTGVTVSCDSVNVNRLPDVTIVPSGTRRTRLGKLMFDNSTVSYFMTTQKVTSDRPFYIEHTWYTGLAAPNRTLPDVVAYTVTVPNTYIGPGDEGFAPSNWIVEYRDVNTGRWVAMEGAEVFAANFNDGTDVDSSGDEVSSGGVAMKLLFLLP